MLQLKIFVEAPYRGISPRRWAWLAVVATVLLSALPLHAQPPPPEEKPQTPAEKPQTPAEARGDEEDAEAKKLQKAKELYRAGIKLDEAGAFGPALKLYLESRALVASVHNTLNAANCLYRLKRYDEALELYEELLSTFARELSAEDRALIAPMVARLRGEVGSVLVQANVAGMLVVDGRPRGRLPLVTEVRVLPGERMVRVIKEGYRTYEGLVVVHVGQTTKIDARLQPLEVVGKLAINDPDLTGAEVIVDGALVGKVPYEGKLEPGKHYFTVRRGDWGSAPKQATVVQGQTAVLSAHLEPLGPELRLTLVPPSAELSIDGEALAKGIWRGRLPLGKHRLLVREEGYFDAERTLTVTTDSETEVTISLQQDEEHARWGLKESELPFVFEALAAFAVAPAFNSGAEQSCEGSFITCNDSPPGLGFLIGARVGYELPFGLAIEAGGGYLSTEKSLGREFVEEHEIHGSVRYELEEELRVSAAFAGLGLGYRLSFAHVLELRPHLLAGALFTFSSDTVMGTARSEQFPPENNMIEIKVVGSGSVAGGAALFFMPSLELGLRFGGFGIGLTMSALFVTMAGPDQNNSELRPKKRPVDCDPYHTQLGCMRASGLVNDEQAYGPFVVFLPGLYAGYAF